MTELYISLEEAARLEGIKYNTLVQRLKRNSTYQTLLEPAENGGKERVMVAVSSLSPKARRKHKAEQRALGSEVVIDHHSASEPWYVSADLNSYIENKKETYYKAIALAGQIKQFMLYSDRQKTEYAAKFAMELGISIRSLYRYTENIIEASAWAIKLEGEDGHSRDYFAALALCRKPSENDKFPSLSVEQRVLIENIWFDKGFAANLGTYEMVYEKFCEISKERGWGECPSCKTVSRYIQAAMSRRGAASAHYYAANGSRDWKNKMMLKAKRDATTLEVMEHVVGDEHTFDFWVQVDAGNGKVKAIRPKLVAWMDMRSRCIGGDIACENANSQVLKESIIKLTYSAIGGVPKEFHIDNGKDYTGKTMTGQSRNERKIEFDAETMGFYQSIGVQHVHRSLPYQPWDKPIERAFSTVCSKFSKWFDSYTGTLTGSKTYAKREKDIDKMLQRGELLTMEEFFEIWTEWLQNKYHKRVHRGLKDAGEQWKTPIEVFNNAERYLKAVPPREYAAMLLMKASTALVRNQGITKFGVLYSHYELGFYTGKTVGIKWDLDNVSKLYVYDETGKKICEAEAAELLQFGSHVSQAALEEHLRKQKRQEKEIRQFLAEAIQPYELRVGADSHETVGKLDLTIKANRPPKGIALPNDKEFRHQMAEPKKVVASNEFFDNMASSALSRIQAMNE